VAQGEFTKEEAEELREAVSEFSQHPEPKKIKLISPMTGYQGGKRRYALAIATRLIEFGHPRFYDLGAGSGAITLALISLGVSPTAITAVDSGPWGWVWESIGKGSFDVMYLRDLLAKAMSMPPRDVRAWVESTILQEAPSPEIFVILQAASFGSAPLWRDESGWRVGETGWRYCARGFWEPPPGSPETKARGTIFSPNKIIENAERAALACLGLDGRQCRAEDLSIDDNSVVYIDPPYEGVWGYGTKMDWRRIVESHRPVVVSEGVHLVDATHAVELASRKEGAFKGKNRGRPSEWLNIWERTG
jgi:hypothetical protein